MNSAEEGQIDTVTIIGNDIFGTYSNGTRFKTYAPFDPSMVETLRKQNVKIVHTHSAYYNHQLVNDPK